MDGDGDGVRTAVLEVTLDCLLVCGCVVKVEDTEEVSGCPCDVDSEGTTLELVAVALI